MGRHDRPHRPLRPPTRTLRMARPTRGRTVRPPRQAVWEHRRTIGRTVRQVRRTMRTVTPTAFRWGWARRDPMTGGRCDVRPTEVLAELTRRGVEIAVDGDRLRFRPQDAVTADLRAALIEHKADLIRLLGPDDEVAWRIEAMRPQVPRT